MQNVILIRHGQANSAASDEESYDNLSPIGHAQAKLLGKYLRQTFDDLEIWSGSLRRQRDTARYCVSDPSLVREDPRLNEMTYFNMAAHLHKVHKIPYPSSQQEFQKQLELILTHWRDGSFDEICEPWSQFQTRIHAVLEDAFASPNPVALVTSTGVIATLISDFLDVTIAARTHLFCSVSHTSIHRISRDGSRTFLGQFAAVPHIDQSQDTALHTYV